MADELKEKKEDKDKEERIKEERVKEEIKEEKKEEQKEVKKAAIEKAAILKVEPRKRSLTEILLREKPSKLFLLLLQDKQWRLSILARESNQSYVYATELIKEFTAAGLISVNSNGRKRTLKLTEKGEKIAKALQGLVELSATP